MFDWTFPAQRAAKLGVLALRPIFAYGILAALCQMPHLGPTDLHSLMRRANAADEPLVGARDLSLNTVSQRLAGLRAAGLVMRCDQREVSGARTTYEVTRLGAGLIGSLPQVTVVGQTHFNHFLEVARHRWDLPTWPYPVPLAERGDRLATGLVLSALWPRWTLVLLLQIHLAGGAGLTAGQAQVAATGFMRQMPVWQELHRSRLYAVLGHLESADLLFRRLEGAGRRVLYRATPLGRALLEALEPMAVWGAGLDAELLVAVRAMSQAAWLGRGVTGNGENAPAPGGGAGAVVGFGRQPGQGGSAGVQPRVW